MTPKHYVMTTHLGLENSSNWVSTELASSRAQNFRPTYLRRSVLDIMHLKSGIITSSTSCYGVPPKKYSIIGIVSTMD